MGRHIFDGASPEQLAAVHQLSVNDVNQAWYDCRERLSKHFAEVENREYQLLNDIALQARAIETLKLLLEWRESERYKERLTQSENGTGTSTQQGFTSHAEAGSE